MAGDVRIVTAFHKTGWDLYGERMVDSYVLNEVPYPLTVYVDDFHLDLPVLPPTTSFIRERQQEDIPGLTHFLNRHQHAQEARGLLGRNPRWTDREKTAKYSYRFDAYKFCRMVYVMWDAARKFEEGIMVWLDGDCVFRKSLPKNFISRNLPEGAAFSYLGREPKHTETGFLIFKLPDAMPILQTWRDFYDTDEFFDFKEWHSAYLFDRARECHPEIRGHNLTPGGRGHVIHQCDVGTYIDHLKGNRKTKGRSPEARGL